MLYVYRAAFALLLIYLGLSAYMYANPIEVELRPAFEGHMQEIYFVD